MLLRKVRRRGGADSEIAFVCVVVTLTLMILAMIFLEPKSKAFKKWYYEGTPSSAQCTTTGNVTYNFKRSDIINISRWSVLFEVDGDVKGVKMDYCVWLY